MKIVSKVVPSYQLMHQIVPGESKVFDRVRGLWDVRLDGGSNDTVYIGFRIYINDSTEYFVKGFKTIVRSN